MALNGTQHWPGKRNSEVMSKLYLYDPSLAAACVFVALFCFTGVAQCLSIYRRRARYFVPFAVGIFFEILGYVARAVSTAQTPKWTVMPYALQSLMLLVAPSLLAASIYGILGKLITFAKAEAYSPIRPAILTKVFVTSDIVSFFVQSGGGGILSNAKSASSIQLGENVIIVGLFIQLIGFSLFISVAGIFHWRIVQEPRGSPFSVAAPWSRYLWVLYGVSVLVLIRSLFRVVEYVQGYDGL
jgi:hypothetical protein